MKTLLILLTLNISTNCFAAYFQNLEKQIDLKMAKKSTLQGKIAKKETAIEKKLLKDEMIKTGK